MSRQHKLIVGVDEVGRGPWAGPLVAAAVIWDSSTKLKGLTDSKLLDYEKRIALAYKIRRLAMDIGLGWVSPKEIDHYGLTKANRLAMLRALAPLNCKGLEIIVDGRVDYLRGSYHARTVIKADRSVPAVSAASIVAKVARDNFMHEMARLYPQYGFERHVGYGTRQHMVSLNQYGPSPLHRLLFKPANQISIS